MTDVSSSMTSPEAGRRVAGAHPSADPAVHPFLTALGPAGAGLIPHGRRRAFAAGETLGASDGGAPTISLVLAGAAALIGDDPICFAIASPGDVFGEAALAGAATPTTGRWLTVGETLELPAAQVRERADADRLLSAVLTFTERRSRAVQRQVTCVARHLAAGRLARLMLAIHRATGERTVAVTQLELAVMMGLQRTSVNAAVAALSASGAVEVIRGRFSIADITALERAACCP